MKKKERRATGVYAKSGMLYVVTSYKKTIDGETKYLNKWTCTNLTDIKANIRKAKMIREDILLGVSETKEDDKSQTLLCDFLNNFLAEKKRVCRDTTYAAYKYRAVYILDYFPEKKIRDLTKSDVEEFLDYICTPGHTKTNKAEKQLSKRTVEDIRDLLVSILDKAKEEDIVSKNIAKNIPIDYKLLESLIDEDETFFSYEESMRFLQYAEESPFYELFYLTLYFGLRRSEVLGLQWDSVDLFKKELTIKYTVTKGTKVNRLKSVKTSSSYRTYSLTDDVIKVFKDLKDKEERLRELQGNKYSENNRIFKNKDGKDLYIDTPSKAFRKIIKKHPDLPQDITFHGLRVSCASILVHLKFDIKQIQDYMGHSDINTTLRIYTKIKSKESKKEVSSKLSEILTKK